ncbi:hypothetical protein EJ08DRAFT_693493 [Tothia fuscella]|uniref:Uncharacterized protein n=1 Tax=Tothia fuscella TaxID=1048955 RepID=A0A9P4NXX4_9PEZI|nr:hypothetical protein EJ08DRAFT_693493 [Tothia fuscella]
MHCSSCLISGQEVLPGIHKESAERSSLAFDPPYFSLTGSNTHNTLPHANDGNAAPRSWPLARPPTPLDPSLYTRARRAALIPHTSSLSLAETSEIILQRIGTPLLPPPDSTHLSRLTSNPHPPILAHTTYQREKIATRKRKHSALLLDEESGWSCGTYGCGSRADSKHLSELDEGEGFGLGLTGSAGVFAGGKGSGEGWTRGNVSPLTLGRALGGRNQRT